MDGWLWETLFQPWIRNFQKQDEWWCPAPAVETSSTSGISNKDGNRNLWKTLKAFFSRVINLLLTKLARDRTERISALGLIFPQYGPRAWLIRYLTIIPRARMGPESIAHEAEGRMGYWLRGHEGERNNCFSKIQLVGQKNIETERLSLVKARF